jgi:hypothetical protein
VVVAPIPGEATGVLGGFLVFLAIAYKDRLERRFRSLHERYLRRQKRDGVDG